MFRIGEFSKIAQVSGRLLRYYDEIGLLQPAHIDPESGYRFYSAQQLPRLNRILALKDLGMSLDQIARLLDEEVSTSEMRGMLMMKKAEIERSLQDELARIRHIEKRIEQIDSVGHMEDFDVVVKSVPSQRFLAVRETYPSLADAITTFFEIRKLIPARVGQSHIGKFSVIVHSETWEDDAIDFEMGCLLTDDFAGEIALADGRLMTVRQLPAVEMMATIIRVGTSAENPVCYGALGTWVEAKGYRLAGMGREVFLTSPAPGKEHETVTEIQFPVAKIQDNPLFLAN